MKDLAHPWRSLVLRGAGCATLILPLWHWAYPAIAMPAFMLLGTLAQPLIEIGANEVRRIRRLAYRDVEGVYFEHAGFPIRVVETEHARWLRAAQVQRVLGDNAREEVFARRLGAEATVFDGQKGWFLRDQGLLDYLERSPKALEARRNGLRLFLRREVIDPHRRRQARAG